MQRFKNILLVYVLHRVDCSVLAIKPEGFVTPVTLEKE